MGTVSLALAITVAMQDTTPPVAHDPVTSLTAADSIAIAASALRGVDPPQDTVRRRRHAITYSDAYALRLKVHRIGSYTMLPLFAAEYALGQNLLNDSHPASWLKPTHVGVALGVGTLFTVNTVTGALNLWESRNDPADRARRWIHASLMLASDAGFVWTGAVAGGSHTSDQRQLHKNVALTSIGLSTAGTVMMWLWKN
jgi:hypothetical protein